MQYKAVPGPSTAAHKAATNKYFGHASAFSPVHQAVPVQWLQRFLTPPRFQEAAWSL